MFGEKLLNQSVRRNSVISSSTAYVLKLSPTNVKHGIVLDVFYDSYLKKNYMKIYDRDTDSITYHIQTNQFEPYFYTNANYDSVRNSELVHHNNFIKAEETDMKLLNQLREKIIKITVDDYTSIYKKDGIRSTLSAKFFETHVYPHLSYIFDTKVFPGLQYSVNDSVIKRDKNLDNDDVIGINTIFKDAPPIVKDFVRRNIDIFTEKLPKFKRLAFDIEVEETVDGGFPNQFEAQQRVLSIAFKTSTGEKCVYALNETGTRHIIEDKYIQLMPDIIVRQFKTERVLLLALFKKMWEYPVIISFNGDNFDNMYLYNRAKRLSIEEDYIPIVLYRGRGINNEINTEFKNAVHLDLFQLFSNRSLKVYAFGGKYLKNGLDDIAKEVIKRGKIVHAGYVKDLKFSELVYYNYNDADITYELTHYDNDFVMNLVVILMRITKLPLHELMRSQIAHWILSYLRCEHRDTEHIIPNKEDLFQGYEHKHGYEGALVIDPVQGIYFDVGVADFASLYPSIIKTRNLSYETINCPHDECKCNMIPNTPYWACTKEIGVSAYMVGFLRDIRIVWFKPIASNKSAPEEKRILAKVLISALKVFINSAYGVFGDEDFPMFCLPVAESTTAVGRFSILEAVDFVTEQLKLQVLYGDTDSIFIHKVNAEQIGTLQKWTDEHLHIEIELDKEYQFLALSNRKKNYIGVKKGGVEIDMKGVLAKKHSTPEFIKNRFKTFLEVYKTVTDMDKFNAVKTASLKVIRETLRKIGRTIENGGYTIDEYGVTMMLKRNIWNYKSTTPQHVKAAKLMPKEELELLGPGSFITFIKTRDKLGVKPIALAKIEDVNVKKYKEAVQSTFEQLLDALGISWEEVLGTKTLDQFTGGKK